MRIKAISILRVGTTTLRRNKTMVVSATVGNDLVKRGLAEEVAEKTKPSRKPRAK